MTFSSISERFGRKTTLVSKDGEELAQMTAFISPLRYKNKMYLYGVNTEIGYNSQGHYLYIGPPDPDITLSAEDREIGGLGIFIAKKTMDTITYAYENGENVLTMIKKI